MFGMIIYCRISFQDYFPMPKIRISQRLSSSGTIKLRSNFIYHYQSNLFKNIKKCNKFRSQIKTDSWQYMWGNSAYTSSKFYHLPYKNVHPPKPFIWIWDSLTRSKSFLGSCWWIGWMWETYLEGKSISSKTITTTGYCVRGTIKRQPSIYSSPASSVKDVGPIWESTDDLIYLSMQWWKRPKGMPFTTSSWNSS
jgi:hypothetical protein